MKQYSCKYPEGSLTLRSRSHHKALAIRGVVRINALVMAPKVVAARKNMQPVGFRLRNSLAQQKKKRLQGHINRDCGLKPATCSCESQKLQL